jgi:hypothetical protein
VHLKGARYGSSERSRQFVAGVEERLRQLPGVETVAASNGLPINGGLNNIGYPAGHKELEGQVEVRYVTPGYFKAVGTTLLAGSDVSEGDTLETQPVALVSQKAASLWWPGRSPIGEYVFDDDSKPARVIGVVADTHAHGIAESAVPTTYHPYAQIPDGDMKTLNDWFPTTFVIRTREGEGESNIAVAAGLCAIADGGGAVWIAELPGGVADARAWVADGAWRAATAGVGVGIARWFVADLDRACAWYMRRIRSARCDWVADRWSGVCR